MKLSTTDRICILVDFAADLSAASLPREEAYDLRGAWQGALDWLAGQLGLTRVSDTTDHGCDTRHPIGDDTAETLLWQASHDMCVRDPAGPDGDRWSWIESPRTVAALRCSLGLETYEAARD